MDSTCITTPTKPVTTATIPSILSMTMVMIRVIVAVTPTSTSTATMTVVGTMMESIHPVTTTPMCLLGSVIMV